MGARHVHLSLAAVAVIAALFASSLIITVSADDGGIRWKVSDTFYGRPAVADDGSVIVLMSRVASDGTKYAVGLSALDADGRTRWEIPVTGECTDPVVDHNGTTYYTELSRGSFDSELVAISGSGALLWKVNASAMFPAKTFAYFGAPVVSPEGNVLVTFDDRYDIGSGFGESRLCSFTPSGSKMWEREIVHDVTRICVGTTPGSLIYAITFHGQVQALYPNGTPAWTLDLSDEQVLIESFSKVRNDGGLFITVARMDNGTKWLNHSALREIMSISSNGSVAWRYAPLADMEGASGCALSISGMSEEGDVYICQQGGVELKWAGQGLGNAPISIVPAAVLALGPDGRLIWKNTFPENITLAFPAIVTDRAVYAFTIDAQETGGITALARPNGSSLGTYISPTELWVKGMTAGSGDLLYYFEGTYKGAEQGMISMICSDGLPKTIGPRPLDLVAASVAWSSILGLAAVSGFAATRRKKA